MAKRRKRITKNKKWLGLATTLIVILAGALGVENPQKIQQWIPGSNNYATQKQADTNGTVQYGTAQEQHPTESLASSVLSDTIKEQLKADTIEYNGAGAFVLNKNKNTLNTDVSSAPYVQLSRQDTLGRPGPANAWLTKASRQYRNRSETGNSQTINPVGWRQMKINGHNKVLYNRGHSIGYALAGNINSFDASEANPQNITTQTAWANQSSNGNDKNTGQNYYETLVRRALDANKRVRYRVTPLYEGQNLVPSGSHIEAKSTDGTLNINVFVPNVQPGVKINYADGSAQLVQ